MTGIKAELKRILDLHRGRRQAITRRELRELLDFHDDRKLRLTIAELRREGLPVLFATDRPAGYYLPESLAELRQGMEKLRSYVIDECLSLRSLKVLGARYVAGEGQGRLI